MVAFIEPPEASMGLVPPSVEAVLKGKSIALVGCTDEVMRQLAGALERSSARPRVFSAAAGKADEEAIKSCHLVVLHARPETFGTHWLHPLTVAEFQQPLVLIGVRDHLMDLDPAIVPRAAGMLIDGWQPEEALIRLSHVLMRDSLVKFPAPGASALPTKGIPGVAGRPLTQEAEILLADDDLTVRMLVRGVIQGAGIECRMACDGNEALRVIRDCHPPVVVLDVNMPGIDGYEVLAATRNEGIPARVILLTARQTGSRYHARIHAGRRRLRRQTVQPPRTAGARQTLSIIVGHAFLACPKIPLFWFRASCS